MGDVIIVVDFCHVLGLLSRRCAVLLGVVVGGHMCFALWGRRKCLSFMKPFFGAVGGG